MSRSIVILLAILVVAVGTLFFLAGRAGERPTVRVEKVVTLENLQN